VTRPRFATHKEAVAAGWFSRRHETDAEHRAARAKWQAEHGKKARQRRATAAPAGEDTP